MTIIIPQEAPQSVDAPRIQNAATVETFGGGSGLTAENEGIQNIAKSTNEIATFEKIRADQTAVQGVLAKTSELSSYLKDDQKDGLPAYQGVNAMDGHDKIMAKWKEQTNEYVRSLQPDQQGAASKMIVEQGNALNNYAMAHVRSHMEQHDTNTFNAYVKGETQSASKTYSDPSAVKSAYTGIQTLANSRANRLGYNDTERQDFLLGINSNFHKTVLASLSDDGSPAALEQAKAYFKDNKDGMTQDDRQSVEKWIGDGSIKSQANALVASVVKAHPTSEVDALAAIDKETSDPDVRAMARQVTSSQYAQNRAAMKNDKEQTFFKVQDQITKQGLTDPSDIRQAIGITDWNNMSGEQRRAVLKSGSDIVTSPKMMFDYYAAVKDGSISSMSRADLQTKFLQFASPADSTKIMKAWAEGQKGSDRLGPTQTYNQIMMNAAISAKIIPAQGKPSDDEKEALTQFDNELTARLNATEATGKKLTPTQKIEIAHQLVIDHTFNKPGLLWGSSDVFEPYTKQFSAQVLAKFPDASEDQIAKAYQMVSSGSKAPEVEAFLRAK